MSHRINPYKRFVGSFMPEWLEELEDVSDGAKIVYARLARYAGKDGRAYPKQETLAKATAKPLRTLKRCLKELCDYGLLQSKQRGLGMPNEYHFLYHDVMKDAMALPEVPPVAQLEVPPVAQAYKENQLRYIDIQDTPQKVIKYFIKKVDGAYEALPGPETKENIETILQKATPEQLKKVIDQKAAQFHRREIDARVFNMTWLLRPKNFFEQLSIIERPAQKAKPINAKNSGMKLASEDDFQNKPDGWENY